MPATLWETNAGMTMVDLGTLAGGTTSVALDIVGYSRDPVTGKNHATLWEITDTNA